MISFRDTDHRPNAREIAVETPIAAVGVTLAALIILGLLLLGGLALFLVGYILSGGTAARDPKPLYQAAGGLLAAVTLAASTFFAASQANQSATEGVREDVTQKIEEENEDVKRELTEEIEQATE